MNSHSDIRRVRRLAGFSALGAALLFALGSAIWGLDMPDRGTPADELLAFYEDTADRIVIGASISLLAIALLLLTAAAIRRVLIEAEGDDVLATTAFAGAIVGVGAGLTAETVNMMGALRAQDGELSEELARSLFEIPQMMGSVGVGLGFGVFALATAAVAWRSGRVIPRYDAVAMAIIGILMLSPLAHFPITSFAGLILLALILGVQLLRPPPAPSPATPTRSSRVASR
jgi:hypothetical protein